LAIRPAGAFILIRREKDAPVESPHGIIIRPGVVYSQITKAEILALGPKCGRFGLKVGDVVGIHPSAGSMVKDRDSGEELYLVREIDLTVKYEEIDEHVPAADLQTCNEC